MNDMTTFAAVRPGRLTALIAVFAAIALCAALTAGPARGGDSGGLGTKAESSKRNATVPGSKAKLKNGRAIPPEAAPPRVRKVIRAANKIRNKPYRYGGGHASFRDSGYDCSGAVSYALRGGKLLRSPLDSNGLAGWGKRGKGKWITVYGASSHAYMVVAGLRFDTAMTSGDGPSWSKSLRSVSENYKKRHKGNL